jgi:hypothetical protein
MFDTLKYAASVVNHEWSKSCNSLDDRIDHSLKLTSICIITLISLPFVVSFDIGIELGNQYLACRSSVPISVPIPDPIPDPIPALVLRRSARLAAKRALLQ